ncbi:MAG: hypothetical protein ACRDNY_10620 [Gaiellaceae bacterium]
MPRRRRSSSRGDVWGAVLADALDGKPAFEVVERDDGFLTAFDARYLLVDAVDASLGRFDTIVLLGQNFGMLGSAPRARRLLSRLSSVTTRRGRIVAETFDPHALDDPVQRRYLERNRSRGRMPGQLRVRVRYRELATPWLDWLQVSPEELRDLLDGTGWRLSPTLGEGPSYVAIPDRA